MAKNDTPVGVENMRAAFAAGDVRRARELARALAEAEGPVGEEARRLLERTAIDPRALAIGAGAFGLGLLYLVVFVLLR